MEAQAQHIPLNHARDYLRQHFAVAAGLDPVVARPLGTGNEPLDPDERAVWMGQFNECRDRAHEALAGYILEAKLTVWGESAEGNLQIVAPDAAADRFDGVDGLRADGLLLDRQQFETLVRQVCSKQSQEYLSQTCGSLFIEPVERQLTRSRDVTRWSDFDGAELPILEELASEAGKDEWWNWPESLAWVGERDLRNIATMRHFVKQWLARGRSGEMAASGGQLHMANGFCAQAPFAADDLQKAIERGEIRTVGRHSHADQFKVMTPTHWLGGKIVCDGGFKLVSRKEPLAMWAADVAVSRNDLWAAFPASSHNAVGDEGGIVSPNRQLDYDKIIAQAAKMLRDQPSLSKGSAAASIVAELPPNPTTGKPRDTRHIERMIAHLWDGGMS